MRGVAALLVLLCGGRTGAEIEGIFTGIEITSEIHVEGERAESQEANSQILEDSGRSCQPDIYFTDKDRRNGGQAESD